MDLIQGACDTKKYLQLYSCLFGNDPSLWELFFFFHKIKAGISVMQFG